LLSDALAHRWPTDPHSLTFKLNARAFAGKVRKQDMNISAMGEKKAVLVDQRAAQRFGLALRLTVNGGEGATHDLSATGLSFESERGYEVDERIELVLEFPGGQRVYPLTCQAQVVRVSAVGEGFNIAVRLLTPLFSDAA